MKTWRELKKELRNDLKRTHWPYFIITAILAVMFVRPFSALVISLTSEEKEVSVQTLSDIIASEFRINSHDIDLNVLYRDEIIVAYGQYITGKQGEDFYDGRGVFLFEQSEPSYIENMFGKSGAYKLTYYIRYDSRSISFDTLYLTDFNIDNVNRVDYDEFVLSLHSRFATRKSDLNIILTRDKGDWKIINFDHRGIEAAIGRSDPGFVRTYVTDFPFQDNKDNLICLYSFDIYGTQIFNPKIMRESAACLIGVTYTCGESTLSPHKVALVMCKFDPTNQSKLIVDEIWNDGEAIIIDREDIPNSADDYEKYFEPEMWAWMVEDGIIYEFG